MINILYLHDAEKDINELQEFCNRVDGPDIHIHLSSDTAMLMDGIQKRKFNVVAFDLDGIEAEEAVYYWQALKLHAPLVLVTSDSTTNINLPNKAKEVREHVYVAHKDPQELLETLLTVCSLPEISAIVDIATSRLNAVLSHVELPRFKKSE